MQYNDQLYTIYYKGTNYNDRIHRYGKSNFGDIILSVSKSIYDGKQIVWRL